MLRSYELIAVNSQVRNAMAHEEILAVLSESKDNAKSLREIALAMDLETTTYIDWIRVEQRLSRALRSLIKWGWVAADKRKMDGRQKFWHNVYWKTDFVKRQALQ
jgi:hypothetical protein